MKKLFYPLFALAAMAMTTSCSDELENGVVQNSNEATVSFKVKLENAVGSRAAGDGKTAKELLCFVYKWEEGKIGDELQLLRDTVEVNDDLTAQVQFTLVKGQTYNFLFWAQNENSTHYYVDPVTGIVDVKYNDDETTTDVVEHFTAANNEERDAFFKVRTKLNINGPVEETITLKRPFAQINVGTAVGSLADAKKAELEITKSSFYVDNAATKLNTYTGAATDGVAVSYTINNIIEDLTDLNDGEGDLKNVGTADEKKNYEHLAMNYILVADEKDSDTTDKYGVGENKQLISDASFKIYDKNGKEINEFKVPNLPVQRNFRTNIIGDIMNETITFNIVIDAEFDNDHNYYTEEELEYAAANGGHVVLSRNYELTKALEIKNTTTIDLNGYEIKATNSHAFNVLKGGKLTINGAGNVTGGSGGDYHAVRAEGLVIINNGIFTVGKDANGNGNSCIEAKAGGEVIINNGTFSTEATYSDKYWVLNLADKTDAKITVYGGKFIGCDPAKTGTEPSGYSDNFVAEGYHSTKVGDVYYVTKESILPVGTGADLNTALATANANVSLVDYVTTATTIKMAAGTSLNGTMGGMIKLEGTDKDTDKYALTTKGSSIQDLTINGYNERNKANEVIRGIMVVDATEDVNLNNVCVRGFAYALNTSGTFASGLKLNAKHCQLKGWTSFDQFQSAEFTYCHFTIGNFFDAATIATNPGWNGCLRPYVTTVLNSCTFEEGFHLMTDKLNGTITLNKCTVNGEVIDKTNIESLLNVTYDDTKIIIQ